MATFKLTGPDGASYRVEAPDEQTALAAFKKMQAGSQPAPHGSIVDPFMQGMSLGFADEAAGLFGGVADKLKGGSFSEGYQRTRDYARSGAKQYGEAHPVLSTVAEIAGAIPTAIVSAPAAGALRGASLVGRAVGGLAGGAVVGGTQGFGSAEGDIEDRLKGAGKSALVGGVVGMAAPMVAKGLGKAVGAITGRGANEGLTAGEQKIGRALEADQVTPQTIADLSPDAMLANAGPNLTQTAGAIAALPGEGQKIVRSAIANQKAGATGRATAAIDKTMGGKINVPQTVDAIDAARAAEAGPLYKIAYSVPVQLTQPIINVLKTPSGQAALRKAQKIAADEGAPIDLTNLDMRALDYVKRGLDDVIGANQGARQGQQARAATMLKHQLVNELDQVNPDYAKARAVYAGKSELIDAIDAGQSVFKRSLSPDQMVVELNDLSAAGQDAYRQGARSAVAEIMGTARNDAGAAARELSDKGWNREKLAQLFGQGSADEMIKALNVEQGFANTANRVTQNSESAARLAGMADVTEGGRAYHMFREGKNAFTYGGWMGPPRAALAAGADKLITGLLHGANEDVVADMARGLTKSGQERDALAHALLWSLERKKAAQVVSDKVSRIANALMQAGGRATIPQATAEVPYFGRSQ